MCYRISARTRWQGKGLGAITTKMLEQRSLSQCPVNNGGILYEELQAQRLFLNLRLK